MKELFDKFITKYIYLKLCFTRSFSHLSAMFQIVNFLILFSVWLKMFAEINNKYLVGTVGVVLIITLLLVGHLDLKLRILAREVSLANKFNPEIQKLLEGKENDRT